MGINQRGDSSKLKGGPLKRVDKVTYLGSKFSSTEKDINSLLSKACTVIDRLWIIWKSDLTDKRKRSFFQAAVVSIMLYECTTWTLTKHMEKKSLTAITQECCEQYWTSPGGNHPQSSSCRVTDYLSRKLSKLDEADMRENAGSKDGLTSDKLLWISSHGRAKTGGSGRNDIQQLCADTGCNLEDLPEAMDDRYGWQEKGRKICTCVWHMMMIIIYSFNFSRIISILISLSHQH